MSRSLKPLLSSLLLSLVLLGPSCQAAPSPVKLKPVLHGLIQPVHLTGQGKRLYITEQAGRIVIAEQGKLSAKPFLDIRDRVASGGEMGLLSMAFHPRYPQTPKLYVDYTSQAGGLHTRISEFRTDPKTGLGLPGSERILLKIKQPYANHNGGQIAFGRDGMLYIGMGDGGSGGDPQGHGQNRGSLLGKMLRIDVNGNPYQVPADNPFVGQAGYRPEIWATGLRNPWRFSFDRATGLLYAADVGQNAWEEIDIVRKGGNYGWNTMEGRHCYAPANGCKQTGLQLPIAEYGRQAGQSVSGGYVYRGKRFTQLQGLYLYGDFVSGQLFGLRYDGNKVTWQQTLQKTGLNISAFGEDAAGELYLLDYSGRIFQIEAS